MQTRYFAGAVVWACAEILANRLRRVTIAGGFISGFLSQKRLGLPALLLKPSQRLSTLTANRFFGRSARASRCSYANPERATHGTSALCGPSYRPCFVK